MGQDLSGPLSISRGLRCVVFGFFAIAITSIPTAIPANAEISQGDRAWARRAEALDGSRPMLERVETAIANYRAAVELEPASFEARWKLMRALHYAIDFSTMTDKRKDALTNAARHPIEGKTIERERRFELARKQAARKAVNRVTSGAMCRYDGHILRVRRESRLRS